jgi:hypothetical protein
MAFRVNTIVQYYVMMFHKAPLMAASEFCATMHHAIVVDWLGQVTQNRTCVDLC